MMPREDVAALGHPQAGIGQTARAAVGLGHQPRKLLIPDRQHAARLARQQRDVADDNRYLGTAAVCSE
jgi:hypothetical protein